MPDRGTGDSKPAISRPPLSGRASEPARAEDPTVPGPLLRVNWGNLKFSQPFALLLRSCVIAHTFILALAWTPSGQAAPHSVAAHSAGMPSAQARNFPPSPVPLRVLLRIRPAAPISSRHASVPPARQCCAPGHILGQRGRGDGLLTSPRPCPTAGPIPCPGRKPEFSRGTPPAAVERLGQSRVDGPSAVFYGSVILILCRGRLHPPSPCFTIFFEVPILLYQSKLVAV